MAKMVSLKRSAKEREESYPKPAEGEVYPEDEGVAVHLDHHHLTKLGIGGKLKSGDDVGFSGHGKVERSETTSGKGGDRHSATIRLHRGSVEHKADEDERGEIKADLEKSYAASEGKRK